MPRANEKAIDDRRRMTLRHFAEDPKERTQNPERAAEAALALELMDAGMYGFCRVCGFQIPELRIETRPETTRCERCERESRRRKGA